jgi:hypothetical protein
LPQTFVVHLLLAVAMAGTGIFVVPVMELAAAVVLVLFMEMAAKVAVQILEILGALTVAAGLAAVVD